VQSGIVDNPIGKTILLALIGKKTQLVLEKVIAFCII